MFRFCYLLWLVLPQTQGATQLYVTHVGPFLDRHDRELDELVTTAHSKLAELSVEYFGWFVAIVKQYVWKYVLGKEVEDANGGATAASSGSGFQNGNKSKIQTPNFNPDLKSKSRRKSSSSLFSKMFKSSSSDQSRPSSIFRSSSPTKSKSTSTTTSADHSEPSYLDSFFSKFKSPPSLSAESSQRTGLFENADGNESGTQPSLLGSLLGPIAHAGAAAIQSGLQLPKVSAETHQASIRGPIVNNSSYNIYNNNNGSNISINKNNSSSSMSGSHITLSSSAASLTSGTGYAQATQSQVKSRYPESRAFVSDDSFIPSPASNPSPGLNPVTNSTTTAAGPPSYHAATNPSPTQNAIPHNNSSSSSSLAASDLDFDFVKYEPEMGDSSTIHSFDPNAPASSTSSIVTEKPPMKQQSSWFGWDKKN